MILNTSEFVFEAPSVISRARRILIKPCASYPVSYPVTTSRDILSMIIKGIRQVSDADILLLEGTIGREPIYPIFQTLGYNFPRVLTLDVNDCIWVEVDNPLHKPFAIPTFWVPNVVLSSDYLISVTPLKVINGRANLSIMNLLTSLASGKHNGIIVQDWETPYRLGIDKVVADLYFTLPFDLGIIEARQKFTVGGEPTQGEIEECGKVFIGEPYEADCEASQTLGLKTEYLNLIESAKAAFKI